jgi:glycosyltransferase involved in cell wall biosynthesis
MKPVCVVSCPIDTFSGYGHRSRDFVKSLIEVKGQEWDIKIAPQVWGNTPWGYLKNDDPLKTRYISGQINQPEVWIQITVPNEFQPMGKFNIGVTAGIESTVPPPNFIDGMNRMDLNLISSNFSKEIFTQINMEEKTPEGKIIEHKLQKPLEVLLEGLDTNLYFKDPKKSGLLDNIEENFCFLYTGHWLPGNFGEDRKNVATLIKTFLETFKGSKKLKGSKPALLLKINKVDYSLLDKEDILANIRKVKNEIKGELPNIYILHGEFTNEELNLINNDPKIKAFISFTKGEGFGRPLLEQAITGKPVIVSNWSGHTDFIRPEYNVLIGGELKNVHKSASNSFLLEQAQWFNINTEVASKAMKDIYKNYKKYITESRKQTKWLKDNFSVKNMTEILNEKLKSITFTQNIPLQMPNVKLPKLKKVNETNSVSEIKLPKLKKIDG